MMSPTFHDASCRWLKGHILLRVKKEDNDGYELLPLKLPSSRKDAASTYGASASDQMASVTVRAVRLVCLRLTMPMTVGILARVT